MQCRSIIRVGIVAPLVGAWIEIQGLLPEIMILTVAPLVGAWIEISVSEQSAQDVMSLPSWERGLKF